MARRKRAADSRKDIAKGFLYMMIADAMEHGCCEEAAARKRTMILCLLDCAIAIAIAKQPWYEERRACPPPDTELPDLLSLFLIEYPRVQSLSHLLPSKNRTVHELQVFVWRKGGCVSSSHLTNQSFAVPDATVLTQRGQIRSSACNSDGRRQLETQPVIISALPAGAEPSTVRVTVS
eukprot:764036-Hanusia_phi.AAC.1